MIEGRIKYIERKRKLSYKIKTEITNGRLNSHSTIIVTKTANTKLSVGISSFYSSSHIISWGVQFLSRGFLNFLFVLFVVFNELLQLYSKNRSSYSIFEWRIEKSSLMCTPSSSFFHKIERFSVITRWEWSGHDMIIDI